MKKLPSFVCCILLITLSLFVVKGQSPLHDVGVTQIVSPASDCIDWTDFFPVIVTIHNFGTNDEGCFYVRVQISVISPDGIQNLEYDDSYAIETLGSGDYLTLIFDDWSPEALQEGFPFCTEYNVTACTGLMNDEVSANDCTIKNITVSCGITKQDIINWTDDLINYIATNGLHPGVAHPLTNQLNQAINNLNHNNINQAIGKLNQFIHLVNVKESNGQLSAMHAQYLRTSAQHIINCLQYRCF
jgi:hypothetical protein